jgi:SAM-dependent methyltransferase
MSIDPGLDRDKLHECACDPGTSIGAHFDSKVRQMRADASAPLHGATQALLELLGDPHDRTVLELGSGRGGLLLETLRSGAARVTGVELSAASAEIARHRLAEAGRAGQATFTIGDGATLLLEPHDWVVLDRVICCYPDAEALLSNSLRAAGTRYAFSVPDSRGWRGLAARVGRFLDNGCNKLRGRSCTTFVHDLDRIDQTLFEAGFLPSVNARRGLWYIAVFARSS